MIDFNDLRNKSYVGRDCVGFQYLLEDKDKRPDENSFESTVATFSKQETEDGETWTMMLVIERTRDADSQVYRFMYVMPRSKLPLTLIAATGLRYFQLYLNQEIQAKSAMNFMLTDAIGDM